MQGIFRGVAVAGQELVRGKSGGGQKDESVVSQGNVRDVFEGSQGLVRGEPGDDEKRARGLPEGGRAL